MIASDIEPDEIVRLVSYRDHTLDVFRNRFQSFSTAFDGADKLLRRFEHVFGEMLEKGRKHHRAVYEAHNELCIAGGLLQSQDPPFTQIEYEPVIQGSAKSIDFRAATTGGVTVFVDVKTIWPRDRDRWDQYQRATKEEWFPPQVRIHLEKGWLGGELWHGLFAARSRMLEHALGLEGKVRDGGLSADGTYFVLALCGTGFEWRKDNLEDFVSFYLSGEHRVDDPFANMEHQDLLERKLSLDRTISQFAYLERRNFELDHTKLHWRVRPPGVV